MKSALWRTSGFLAGIVLWSAGICHADTIEITLTPTLLSGFPGSTITFSGTLCNTSASTLFLNSAGINLSDGFTPADLDTGPFFANAPASLAAGGSTPTIGLFAIDIPNPFAEGLYQGAFSVLGGVNANAQDTLGSADFRVQVAVTSVPEPSSSLALLVVGIALLRFHKKTIGSLRQTRRFKL